MSYPDTQYSHLVNMIIRLYFTFLWCHNSQCIN